jgi:hypothetical protein
VDAYGLAGQVSIPEHGVIQEWESVKTIPGGKKYALINDPRDPIPATREEGAMPQVISEETEIIDNQNISPTSGKETTIFISPMSNQTREVNAATKAEFKKWQNGGYY